MPSGNYAGRVCRDDRGWLLWNFFTADVSDRTSHNLLPPPKRLSRSPEGLLRVTTFERFDDWLDEAVDTSRVHALKEGIGKEYIHADAHRLELQSEAGFQAFVFDELLDNFRFQARFCLKGKGKCGIVFRVCPETHDGYYLSLDLLKGMAQLRRWQTGEFGSGEHMMQFHSLQSSQWYSEHPCEADVQLLTFGSYLEFSVNGRVILSLADQAFQKGLLGVYLETAHLQLRDVHLNRMRSPRQTDEHLVEG
jgi:beta-fructofuranosidase